MEYSLCAKPYFKCFICFACLNTLKDSQGSSSLVVLVVKNPPANAGDTKDIKDAGLIPGMGRTPGEGHGNQLQYSLLVSPKDRGA